MNAPPKITPTNEIATPRGALRIRPNEAGIYFARFAAEESELLSEARAIVTRLAGLAHPAIPRMEPVHASAGVLDVVHTAPGPCRALAESTDPPTVFRAIADVAEGIALLATLPGDRVRCGPFYPWLFVHDHAGGRLLAPGLWGFAYAVDRATTGARMTARHFIESRESLLGLPSSDRTETYHLGYALFSLLTRREPFESRGELEYFQAITEGRNIAPSALRPDVPRRLDDLISAALAPEPTARPPLGELAAALRSMA